MLAIKEADSASAAGSAADIERFWRVDHRHGRMLTLAKWKFVSG